MQRFKARILQVEEKGITAGWNYIEIPADVSEALMPGHKKAFRVKGALDRFSIEGVGLLPTGGGRFIMAINAAMRKGTGKRKGASLDVQLALDEQDKPLDPELLNCLADAPEALAFFNTLPRGHQRYFSNWVAASKTDATRVKRLTSSVLALSRGLGYGEMIREGKK